VSFVCDADARLLSGEPVGDGADAVEPFAPLAIGVNCCAPEHAGRALDALRGATRLPLAVYANGRGRPDGESGWRFRSGTRDRAYARHARAWIDQGARLVGGCCGTTPKTIRRLARLLRN
jgi:homocysteine S-methyltransferase